MEKSDQGKIQDVPMNKIQPPKGIIRLDIDKEYIKELATSISEIGLLQPILLAIDADGFEVVAGHRRYLAHEYLGLSKIKALIRKMTAEQIGLARATENIQREDLTPVEEAGTYKDLMETYGMTLEQISKKMGKSPGTIKRRMDLLRMPPMLQKAIHQKKISMTVGEELWPIADETALDYYLEFAIENGATKEVARQWAKDWKDSQRRTGTAGGEGGQLPLSIYETRPTYLPCDLCSEAVEINETQVLRICKGCGEIIKANIRG